MQPDKHQESNFYNPSEAEFHGSDRDFEQHFVSPNEVVEWQASEYIQHDKGASWLILVIVVALILVGLAIFFKQWSFAVLIAVMAGAMGYFGFRKPKVVHYRLSENGVSINTNQYTFKEFKAFGVREEGAFYSIILIPVKRLSPAVNLYFAEDQAEDILNILGDHLPVEKIPPDPFENFMRKLHF